MSLKALVGFWTFGLAAIAGAQPAVTAPVVAAEAGTKGPRIQFATPIYDFGKARSGEPVKYNFIFTNVGDAVLELSNVQPQCGCTSAGEFSHKVEPGQTGTIPIQFNTSAYNGQVFKTVTVTSNDKQQPTFVLQFKGTVWKPLEVVPQYTVLNIPPDDQSKSITVLITNHLDEPLELFAPEINNKSVVAELQTNEIGKSFSILLTTVPPLNSGNISGKVVLKTASTNMPTVEIPFWVNIQAPITVLPPQIYLSQAPLPTATAPAITIQNNTAKGITLSEPIVNVPGVDVQLKEVNPGKTFSLMFSFPAGFEVPRGMQAMCTVKSSNPQSAEIKIPIMQAPRPAMAAPVPNPQTSRAPATPATLPGVMAAPTHAVQ